ncbi:MAG: sigma 54-interacting transcriptional regulator [Pirellulales bacterium]
MTPTDEPPTAVDLKLVPRPVYYSLTRVNGPQAGARYRLDEDEPTQIGRGVDCEIMLNDPLCSRVHAIVSFEHDDWILRDNNSRNGTQLDGVKIDSSTGRGVPLEHGRIIRIGEADLVFEQLEVTAVVAPARRLSRDGRSRKTDRARHAGRDRADGASLRYAICNRRNNSSCCINSASSCWAASIPTKSRGSASICCATDRASHTAFLWIDDAGRLKPKLMLPEGDDDCMKLNESLSALVGGQGHALWINKQQARESGKNLLHFADAICVPLVSQKKAVGAIMAYMDRGRFQQHDFDFAISLANIVAVALVRVRKQMSLTQDYLRLAAGQAAGLDELVGASDAMRELKSKIARLARANGSVLIRGESGVGKELVARAVHRAGSRADRPMLSVNCAAIPVELMESQLFGHKAGAFTSADRDHLGYFQQADSGTLFLDEIGELTLEGQAKLLRILEGHPFHPVGSNKETTVDVRVIAATNRDLLAYVRERKFREDLYYRLTVFELQVPPLRDRGGDVGRLIEHFLEHFKQVHGRPQLTLGTSARSKLMGYHWPGNVRQLRNTIDSAVVMAAGPEIQVDELGLRDEGPDLDPDMLRIDVWERKLIVEALKLRRR